MDIENITVKKEKGADRLVLSGGGDGFLIDEMGDEVVDLRYSHLAGMAFFVVENILAHPADVGLFGAKRIMAIAQEFTVLIEQFF